LIYRIAGIGNAKIISKAKPVKQVRNFKELVSESLATWRDQDTLWIKTSGTDSFTLQR
jgi:hypothetical protein